MLLMPRAAPAVAPASSGFTFIEVLVALAVLSAGLLGLATLTLSGLQGSRIALQQTLATALVASMAERLRANRSGTASYALAPGTDLPPPAAACTSAGQCTAAMMAEADLCQWQAEARDALPGALTSIVVTAGAGGTFICVITLQWQQTGDADAALATLTVQV